MLVLYSSLLVLPVKALIILNVNKSFSLPGSSSIRHFLLTCHLLGTANWTFVSQVNFVGFCYGVNNVRNVIGRKVCISHD